MNNEILYHYQKTRRQQSKSFSRAALFCLLYIAGLYAYEYLFDKRVPEDFRSVFIISLSVASLVLLLVA